MEKTLRILLSSLLLGTVFCGAFSGCASINRSEPIAGIPLPSDRMKQIRELGANAAKVPASEKPKYAQTLATVYREESDSLIRREAVLAIANYPCEAMRQTLRDAAKDSDRDVRQAVCKAWRVSKDEESVPELVAILSNESDIDVRLDAIDALGDLKNPAAVPALAAPLSEQNPALQHYTVMALQKITGSKATNPEEWLAYCRGQSDVPKEGSFALFRK